MIVFNIVKNMILLPINVFLLNRSLTEEIAKKIPFNLNDAKEAAEISSICGINIY